MDKPPIGSTLPEIQNISYKHEALLHWFIANPDKTMREAADTFGYTQGWISCIYHSDAFQSRLHELQGEVAREGILSLNEKLTGIAHAAADKLADQMDYVEDPKFLLDAVDKTLGKLGYGQKATVTNNFLGDAQVQQNTVSSSVLEKALERRRQQGLQALPGGEEGLQAMHDEGPIEGEARSDD